ncbi:hypothetical protein OEZ86_009493 [Tetradesmus obliquus]|uniref:Uncharacterized protein n=1 Tax=Tetradesmus obliquus TaxID=3088 RepID=A0ABY8UM08_TETOB|nr:hypothetical protein OEZ85_000940 [Tetradesmus obliquus]WIA42951.1 hypothetical protein OEZ86_009493 [Tetradesmus obliquus]
MEGLWSKEENIAAAFQALRAADAVAPPASRQEVAEMVKWLRTATGGPGSAKLQRRVMEMMRLQEEVGLKPPLQVPFIQAGGVTALLDIIVTGWPEGSKFAESQHDSDVVVLLPVELDLELIACGPCCGQRHLGIIGQGQPLHRSLRRAALAALAEMSNYSPIIEAIVRDGRLFDASWLPPRLHQVLSQYKYELSYGQVAQQRDQRAGYLVLP